jgi:hypothetical protein
VSQDFIRYVTIGQGLYYIGTGVWSLVDIDSFQRVTGPKVDTWLVKTVGALVIVIGAALLLAGIRRTSGPEMPLLSVGSAAGLAAIEGHYVTRRRISPIYLADALAELAIVAAWVRALWRQSPSQ